jgi:hypothetical protein
MKNYIFTFVGGVLVGLALMALLSKTVIPFNPEKTSLKITGPEGQGGFELNVEGESVDYAKILERLFADDFLRGAATGWLAQKEKVYSIQSEDIATAIATQICSPIPDSPLEAMLEKGRECAQKPVAARLRDLSREHKPPFHYVGIKGDMGVPENTANQPSPGRANVCRNGPFFGRKLQIGNLLNSTVIEVEATGSYPCTPAASFPAIQLSPNDALQLFPTTALSRLETVVIVPLE